MPEKGGIFRAITALGDIEERLRRALGLTGAVGTELSYPLPVLPSITVADATLPGYNLLRGRAFAYGASGAAAAAASHLIWKASRRVWIERFHLGSTVATVGEWGILPPGTADPFTIATAVNFVELTASATDYAPLLFGSNFIGTAVAGKIQCGKVVLGASVGNSFDCRVALDVGASFYINFPSLTGTVGGTVYGREL